MITNKDKIINELKKIEGSIKTTELANKTGIDIKNISRYTKALEKEGKVKRTTKQIGKLRLVNIELCQEKKIEFSEEDLAIANFGKTIKKEEPEEIIQKTIIAPEVKIKVIAKPRKSKKKVLDICPECNRKYKIFQDKDMTKEEILKDIAENIRKYGDLLTLDFWRGQKFNYDNLFEMRKL